MQSTNSRYVCIHEYYNTQCTLKNCKEISMQLPLYINVISQKITLLCIFRNNDFNGALNNLKKALIYEAK